jgi:predicted pyridoxine 5'-phosphate oxidase superfamily flavin-nucleotide-binding protein
VLDHLNARMREFTAGQEWFFLATADSHGECDSSFRAGPSGILHVLDEKTLCYPEYRGNGVLASLGNIRENPHIGILMVDFTHDRIGLHVNGRARLVPDGEMRERHRGLPVDDARGRRPVVWVEAEVTEAYIHCSKHIPRLVKAPLLQRRRAWGSDNSRRKGGDYFGVKAARPSALRWFRTSASGGSGGGSGSGPGGGTREVAADGVPGGPVGGPDGTGVPPLN